jgi:hypothetical protein
MKKFTFDQTYREIDIAGEIYRIDFADEQLKAYQSAFAAFHSEMEQLSKLKADEMTYEQNAEALDKQKNAISKMIEVIFGANSFEKLYEKAGNSLLNIAKLLHFVGEEIRDATAEMNKEKRTKYVKAAKKRA